MTTAYTGLLGLALPVTGELSGTWGDTVNNYITQYVDAAVAGAQVISGSQTAVTLSTTNGIALSQAGSGATGSSQYAIINCTGNPASLLTITAPASSKAYLVLNSTSTSQSVKVVGAGPTTGVTIAAGRAALIAWNGSDFVVVATNDLTALSGTLPVSMGGTGQTSYTDGQLLIGNSTGNTLNKATLTAGSGISITNGSGSITISSSAAGDVVGPASATDNAVARFDGTTGKLLQNSAVTIADTTGDITTAGKVFTAAGTALAPAYSTSGDTNTGVYFPGANQIGLAADGLEMFTVNPGSGLTSSRNDIFQIGSGNFSHNKTTITWTGEILAYGSAGSFFTTSGILTLNGNEVVGGGVPSVKIGTTSANRVGVGTFFGIDPVAKLHIRGTSTDNCNIRLENTSGRTWEVNPYQSGTSENPFSIRDVTASLNRLIIDSDGNVLALSDRGGVGYGTGAGGAVTQGTSRTTGVTLNRPTGAITLVSAAGTTAWQSFTVTNSVVAATDTIIVNQKSGTDLYEIHVTAVSAGSFRISFRTTGGTTTEQPVFNFAIVKGVTS